MNDDNISRHRPEPISRLDRDIKAAAATLTDKEARYLVANYYRFQEDRIRTDSQLSHLVEEGDPHLVLSFFAGQAEQMEKNMLAALDRFSNSRPIGNWARQVYGVGPVIAAGLIAHIDIHKATTVSKIYRFGGLDPTVKWEKGQKRPWNADLKLLFWKLGQSFIKVSNKEGSVYGKFYRTRKAFEEARNDAGTNAALAAQKLIDKNYRKGTETYDALASGHLAKGQLNDRAARAAVKLFLSHFHAKWRALEGLTVPVPYAFAHLKEHHDVIAPEVP